MSQPDHMRRWRKDTIYEPNMGHILLKFSGRQGKAKEILLYLFDYRTTKLLL